MPYGNRSSAPTMVYEYRAYPPLEGREVVIDEMYRRQRLWNKLVEIDRECRSAQRELTGEQPWREAIAQRPEIASRLDLIDVRRRNAVHDACRDSGLHWVNADDVKASYEQAIRTHKPLYDWWKDRETEEWRCIPWDLRFRRPDGATKVALRAKKTPRWLTTREIPHEVRYTPEIEVTMLIGRDAVPSTFRVRQHRPLPDDAVIVRVELGRRLVGYHDWWTLRYTVETNTAQKPCGFPARRVNVRFGWRVMGNGLRVATWIGDDGRTGALMLPEKIIRALDHVDDLASIRKDHNNAALTEFAFVDARDLLANWLRDDGDKAPEWLRERTTTLERWDSPQRLCQLMDRWHREGTGSGETYDLLQAWTRREHHLRTEQENLRQKALAHRDWLYGNFAAQLCRDYDEIVLHTLDLKRIARDTDDPATDTARRNRQRANVSGLVTRIKNTARREGVGILESRSARNARGEAAAKDTSAA